ncbi:uncharacterized protein LOC125072623 [Vanessa atalanta]|uniref:uncharacterized protein LOC125072623 n=1 Tax=Vanessa atalanta TaxID=42275 RepID=UPI001FCD616B|nr:uncharacterized protein LOC125072623 [Vanessa atalanta]XP_047539215.1 uncharacterized protein LOC125072623 [Vanessa atalanta]
MVDNSEKVIGGIKFIIKTDSHYAIEFETSEKANLHILNNHVFRYYMSPSGIFLDFPIPINPDDVAKIVVKDINDYGFEAFRQSILNDVNTHYIVQTRDVQIVFDKIKGTMNVVDLRMNKEVLHEIKPLSYADCNSTQMLKQHDDEYFFGGGMQNGRFSHKGEIIYIKNTNEWDDGGVTSACPFYWSSYGYGVLRNTWQKGTYDFGDKPDNFIEIVHEGEDFDAYYFINSIPKDILNDYYELTGQPLLMPEYAFYEAHLNAFNRDYWVKVTSDTRGAILFEDGEYYKSYKPNEIGDKKGILESLNGEKNNYQFSARAMIDRYKKHDVPLGWFIPNDGYGSGYGQTDSLDGDIQNLKEFVDYSLQNGVEVALWTESNLHPVDPLNPKKGERDLGKEVGVANVVALKCDVAWIGSGYSFGLSAVENATNIFVKATKTNVRPMIIMVDGWAGTQRYSGIWSGDQKGGEWEYIRFHIPTYIGAGLSGLPIVGSDMDGIYAGGCKEINIRDYQWKTFTPLQLNMDGWGNTPKTPFSYDEEAIKINRAYLKLKSILMPYNYSIGYESIYGLPMVRAMFLEFPEETSAYTKDSQYQYMWGPNILVAPIYNDVKVKETSVRDGIYLPNTNQIWIDFMTGKKYQGGKIYNNILTPLWKIPIFIKEGSIVPMTKPHNNPYEIIRDLRIFTLYPNGTSSFKIYEDDGITSDYLKGDYATTKILAIAPTSNRVGDLLITIYKTRKSYKNMVKERSTLIQIMTSQEIENIKVAINGKSLILNKAESLTEFENQDNSYYFDKEFCINSYLSEYDATKQKCLLIKIEKFDVTANEIAIKVTDFTNQGEVFGLFSLNKQLEQPQNLKVSDDEPTSTISLKWDESSKADFYEIERDGVVFTNIKGNSFTFKDFAYNSKHNFRIRTVWNKTVSEWTDYTSGIVMEDPLKYIITGVKVACNLPCQPCQEVCNLTDGNLKSIWHTDWGTSGQSNPKEDKYLTLHFDLGDIYELDKAEYIPRSDAGNGTFLMARYRYSVNRKEWSAFSESLKFKEDNSIKTINFHGNKMRFIELSILETVGNFGSGRQLLFFKM